MSLSLRRLKLQINFRKAVAIFYERRRTEFTTVYPQFEGRWKRKRFYILKRNEYRMEEFYFKKMIGSSNKNAV
jgi:hypothetical protein